VRTRQQQGLAAVHSLPRVAKALMGRCCDADSPTMSDALPDLSVIRWKRIGQDRVYVMAVDASEVGWWDLVTGVAHPQSA